MQMACCPARMALKNRPPLWQPGVSQQEETLKQQFISGNAGKAADIILLGEHSLVVLGAQGQLRLQKRFDYQPVAFTTYPVRQQITNSV